jgi:hypothetical protein
MSSGMFLSYGDMPRMTDFDLQNGASLGDTTPSKANKMSEIRDIPIDILSLAAQAVNDMPDRPPFKADVLDAIAKAIWAERQRNAKIAENEMLNTDLLLSQPPKSSAAFRISQAILNQTE